MGKQTVRAFSLSMIAEKVEDLDDRENILSSIGRVSEEKGDKSIHPNVDNVERAQSSSFSRIRSPSAKLLIAEFGSALVS
ncbi:hypothetical protein FRX31_025731 [Thalictrum thalictroides]|uniref:Uncharacterized protein n=1 Tax=Thalictrum thalictroides TaxID=46969 RepID=A0A7J6VIY0_THATH|nr:hypothetical protein FRX31_025731 [Thalictrum thalictroides]